MLSSWPTYQTTLLFISIDNYIRRREDQERDKGKKKKVREKEREGRKKEGKKEGREKVKEIRGGGRKIRYKDN